MIGAGQLNRRVTIIRVLTQNVRGIAKKQSEQIAVVWAKLEPISQSEKYSQEQTTTPADFEFTIMWSKDVAGLQAKDQLHYDGKMYELVEQPREVGLRRHLTLRARLFDGNS